MPPLLSGMFFDHETCPGPSLVSSSGLSRVDPFLGSVWIIVLSRVDFESHSLYQYRMRYRGHFPDSLSPRDHREASFDVEVPSNCGSEYERPLGQSELAFREVGEYLESV